MNRGVRGIVLGCAAGLVLAVSTWSTAAAAIKDNKEWKEARVGQITVKATDLVAEVRKILARHTS